MKFRSLLMSAMVALLAGFVVVGCNENPDDPTTGDDPEAVTNLAASSYSDSEVALVWDDNLNTGVTYEVIVSLSVAGTAVDTVTSATESVVISGLTPATRYTFAVYAVDGDLNRSTASLLEWAPAARFEGTSTVEFVMYEKDSPNGSGLDLYDGSTGGPRNLSVAASSTSLSQVQLAMFVGPSGTNFKIGPAHGFTVTEYSQVGSFDQTVVVSDSIIVLQGGLDSWFFSDDLSEFIGATPRTAPFSALQSTRTNTNEGYAFIVRTGAPGAYNYARVYVRPGANGQILQGTAPNRYVSVEISYQTGNNLPYAK